MFVSFFQVLRQIGIPVTARELLDLLLAIKNHLAFANIDDFYLLSRMIMVKDEKYFDRYDRAFGAYFKDLEDIEEVIKALIPEEWLSKGDLRGLTDEEKEKVEAIGDFDKLMELFKQRLKEQKGRHAGGPKWIGTGGMSAFGHGGYNPEGIRVGGEGGGGNAVKVWDKREFANLDDNNELGSRNIQVALRRLRKFARTGAAEELDLNDTIRSTARDAGLLNIKMVPERHNSVKVLLFLDVGGSMDIHIKACEEMFTAARAEFKHLEYFYFHNFIYESVWKDNSRRFTDRIPLEDIFHKYNRDYKVIFIGDAAMSEYEIMKRGGSVEHQNKEPGAVWMKRLTDCYGKVAWINPLKESRWENTKTVGLIRDMVQGHMYPLTVHGLEDGMKYLSN